MRVLVVCEHSGVVRRAFAELGHDAWSCDVLPADDGDGKHIMRDCMDIITGDWDLMIAHPPCTYLCNSGVRWLFGGKGNKRDPKRWALMEAAAEFFRALMLCKIPRKVLENPIQHKYARAIIKRGPTQIIQPWQYGCGETKATGLWLAGVPRLRPTSIVPGRVPRIHHASPGPDRWKIRSKTYAGIARAMAMQWGRDIR
jgi:hypothetical protein